MSISDDDLLPARGHPDNRDFRRLIHGRGEDVLPRKDLLFILKYPRLSHHESSDGFDWLKNLHRVDKSCLVELNALIEMNRTRRLPKEVVAFFVVSRRQQR